jgi:hypothetical protein
MTQIANKIFSVATLWGTDYCTERGPLGGLQNIRMCCAGPVEMFALPGEKRPRGPEQENPDEPKKKKYAKEAWPGRKHGPAQGLF